MNTVTEMWFGDSGGGNRGALEMEVNVQCHGCKHRDFKFAAVCAAYPKGIPPAIFDGPHDHTKPYKGDGGTMYEPVT